MRAIDLVEKLLDFNPEADVLIETKYGANPGIDVVESDDRRQVKIALTVETA